LTTQSRKFETKKEGRTEKRGREEVYIIRQEGKEKNHEILVRGAKAEVAETVRCVKLRTLGNRRIPKRGEGSRGLRGGKGM